MADDRGSVGAEQGHGGQNGSRQPQPPDPAPGDPQDALAALRQRVAALEAENAGLRQRARLRNEKGGAPLDALASQAFRLLVEHGSDVIWTADLRLQPLYLSPASERLTGRTVEETQHQHIRQILTPDSYRRAKALLRRVRRSGASRTLSAPVDMELVHRDGHTVWTESMVTLLKDPVGRPAGFIGITRDIGDRHRFRRELQERNLLLETIFTNLQQIFFSLSLNPIRVEHVSPACETIYGLPPETFLQDPMAWFAPILEEDRPRVRAGLQALQNGEREESVAEYRIRLPDGTLRWMRSRSRVQRGPDGSPARLHGFVADITAEKELEEELLQAHKMEAVGALAGGVAHDMNNVLGVVMGLASVLQAKLTAGSPLLGHVEGILSAARRGRSLTQNLLGFARKGDKRSDTVNLNTVVEDVLDLLERTLPKSVTLSTRLQGTLDHVVGDPDQLHLVLLNLCLNARDAMPEGGSLTLSSRNLQAPSPTHALPSGTPPGHYVQIRVEDTGVGMDEEARTRAFEPFFTTKPPGHGTGLGLSIVYSTVTALEGHLHLDSQPGAGTRVTLLLPALRQKTPPPPPRPGSSETLLPPVLQGARVLVVDDEPLFRHTAELMLSQLGYEAHCVSGGAEALRTLQQPDSPTPSLVLLDLQMPEMDGRETYHHLRRISPTLPVVLCSGYARADTAKDLLRKGAAGYLRKPFDVSELGAALARGIAHAPTEGTG